MKLGAYQYLSLYIVTKPVKSPVLVLINGLWRGGSYAGEVLFPQFHGRFEEGFDIFVWETRIDFDVQPGTTVGCVEGFDKILDVCANLFGRASLHEVAAIRV